MLFRATLAGDVVPLHHFAPATGTGPLSALLQHTNGKLYGSTVPGRHVPIGRPLRCLL